MLQMKKQLNIPQGGSKSKSSSGVSSPSGAPRASPASQRPAASSSQISRPASGTSQTARPSSSSGSRPAQSNMVKLTAGSAALKTVTKKQETKPQPKPAGDQEVICIDID